MRESDGRNGNSFTDSRECQTKGRSRIRDGRSCWKRVTVSSGQSIDYPPPSPLTPILPRVSSYEIPGRRDVVPWGNLSNSLRFFNIRLWESKLNIVQRRCFFFFYKSTWWVVGFRVSVAEVPSSGPSSTPFARRKRIRASFRKSPRLGMT